MPRSAGTPGARRTCPSRRELSPSRTGQEVIEHAHELVGRLDMGTMPRGELHEVGAQQCCEVAGAFDRDRVVGAVNDEGRGNGETGRVLPEFGPKVVLAEAGPDGLVGAARDAEGGEVLDVRDVVEVPGDRQLERAPTVGSRVALTQAARAELLASLDDFGRVHPFGEPAVELASGLSRDRCWRYQRQPVDTLRVLEGVEDRQQATPRVSQDRQPLEPEGEADFFKVGRVLAPADGGLARHRRPPAAALVVVEQLPASRQEVVLREQVIVMGAGAAVEHRDERARADATGEKRDAVDLHRRYSSTASASATSLTSACSRSPKAAGTSESMSSWPRIVCPRRISTTSSDLVSRLHAR